MLTARSRIALGCTSGGVVRAAAGVRLASALYLPISCLPSPSFGSDWNAARWVWGMMDEQRV